MTDHIDAAKTLGLSFRDEELLVEALTHRSYLNENKKTKTHNERLEFLGDAVLELVTTHYLFTKFPASPEGELTTYRAALVNTVSLAETAAKIGINDHLRLSKGEARDTGRARQIILADALEAVIGAVYLDQGYDAAGAFIAKHLFPKVDAIVANQGFKDAKSRFQEAAQDKEGTTPRYEVLMEVGPDHDRRFTVGVFLGTQEIARGEGKAKQEAEQEAAQNALDKRGW